MGFIRVDHPAGVRLATLLFQGGARNRVGQQAGDTAGQVSGLHLLQDWRAGTDNTGPGTSYPPASDTTPAADPDLWGGALNQFLISGLWGLVKRHSHELN